MSAQRSKALMAAVKRVPSPPPVSVAAGRGVWGVGSNTAAPEMKGLVG